jgi:hypothetical protein
MMKAETQDMSLFSGGKWSSNSQLIFAGECIGSYVKFWINVPVEDDYELIAVFTKARDYGIVQHYLDNEKLGTEIDLYYTDVIPTEEVSLGIAYLKSGLHVLEARIVSKNDASRGYLYGLDYLRICRDKYKQK